MDALCVCNNPGSFNVVFPIHKKLLAESYKSQLFLVDYGSDHCQKEELSFEKVSQEPDCETIRKLFEEKKPKLLLTGSSVRSSSLGKLESLFRFVAKELSIPSISILDHWTRYRERFSLEKDEHLDALPDIICVMDEFAKSQMEKSGIPSSKIIITGSPYFDRLHIFARELERYQPNELREKIGLPVNKKIVSFISEPISTDSRKKEYNELSVLHDIKKVVGPETLIVIKPHPRDEIAKFDSYLSENTILLKDVDSYQLLKAASLSVGMCSMLLIEGDLLGLPCISYQPTTEIFHFPYEIKVLRDINTLKSTLEGESTFLRKPPSFSDIDASKNIMELMKQRLNEEAS